MYILKEFEFWTSEISSIVEKTMYGKDILITNVQPLGQIRKNSMAVCYPKYKNELKKIKHNCLIFCDDDSIIENEYITYIISENPRFTFFKFLSEFLVEETSYWHSEVISVISQNYPDVKFGYNVRIGKNVVIAPHNSIGSNCIIGNNVVIRSKVKIGSNCLIKDNSVIGSEGFGFIKSGNEIIHIPQIGNILIGDNVTIGSNCTIERPGLGCTIIHDNVKIDDLVQIGHNQEIGEGTMIATGFKAEGGLIIGRGCFIGMGVTIVDASIGNHCIIGAGAIISKPISDYTVAYNKIELIQKDDKNKIDNLFKTPLK